MPQPFKRTATSPLISEFDKKPKLGLTDEERKKLTTKLQYLSYLPVSTPEHVTTDYLALAFQGVANYTSIIDKSWMDQNFGEEHIDRLSPKDRLEFASIWLEARDKGDWSRFASCAASLHLSSTVSGRIQELVEDLSPRLSNGQSEKGPFFCLCAECSPAL